jgi:hypothetical protein
MYTTDDNTSAIGDTIRRFYLNSAATTWNLCGTVGSTGTAVTAEATTTDFTKSITAKATVVGDSTFVDLYLTTWGSDGTGTNSSKLLKFTDVYLNANPLAPARTTAITVLASAPANTVFRSVTFAPTNSTAIGTVTLPTSLQSFNAGVDGKNTNIWWTTTNEVNVKDFTIEKSTDAISFKPIGTRVANNTSQLNAYSFVDNSNTATTAYYRLKITDKDGSFSYSAIIKISSINAVNTAISIAPNPVVGNVVNISHAKAESGSVINIFSIQGKLIQSNKVQAGATQSVVMLQGFVSGNYVIEYVDATNKTKQTISFIKQ